MKGDFTRWSFDPTKHYHDVLKQQGRVDLDADWNERNAITAHRIESEAVDVIGQSGAPIGDAGFVLTPSSGGGSLNISKGRAYVDGILCENEQDLLITAQPDLPGFPLPTAAGTYIAFLEAWLHHVIAADDPGIREPALGGPDTCTRAKTVWQVNLMPVSAGVGCSTDVPAWDTMVTGGTGTLKAQAQPDPAVPTACAVPTTAGYTSLENQLYRVEIHDSGDIAGGKVTFKWSRDNGSVVTGWTAQNGNNLTVTGVGPDSVLGFAAGQWVELTDDSHELNFQTGSLVPLANVEGLILTINPASPSPPTSLAGFPLKPKIRRWDSAGLITATVDNWINLENGVQIQFAAGTYATGDYWLVPARTLTGNVIWPVDGSNNPIARPPRGIKRHYCRLAIVQFDGTVWSVTANCLATFPPLTSITQANQPKAIHVTDVQHGNPSVALPNDSEIELGPLIERGLVIRMLCDAPIDPISAQQTTCYLTVELPYPYDVLVQTTPAQAAVANLLGFQPMVLPGQVSVRNGAGVGEIDLVVPGGVIRSLRALLVRGLSSQFLARLTVKGHFIWGLQDPTTYLDGAAFGVARRDPDGTHIALRLPKSGAGLRGSDFEMWFWLVRPVRPKLVSFSQSTITAGDTAFGTVELDGLAPRGGAAVVLTAGSAGGTITPTTVNIAEGILSGGFEVSNTSVASGQASTNFEVTASYAGATAVGTLTIQPRISVIRLVFDPNPGLAANVTGTVTLSGPAPATGATVTLTFTQTAPPVQIPASVSVAANATTGTFRFPTPSLVTNGPNLVVPVTASYAGTSVVTTLTMLAPILR